MKFFKNPHKGAKWLTAILLTPIVLFLLLVVLLYIPPIQNAAVHYVAHRLSESTGMDVTVERVRLSFPLDLKVQQLSVVDHGDTVVAAQTLRLDVRLLPLFVGRADVDGFGLYSAQVNTKDFIADTYIRGKIGRMEARSHGVEWGRGAVQLDQATLRDASLFVALSDTAREEKDTTASMPWVIHASHVALRNTSVSLSLPGDSMRIAAQLKSADLLGGDFDTGAPSYAVRQLTVRDGALTYATRNAPNDSLTPFMQGNAAYTLKNSALWDDFKAAEGLDLHCLKLDRLNFRVDSISYDSVGTLRAHIRQLSLRERCGLQLSDISGQLYMDSVRLSLPSIHLRTPYSRLGVGADIALAALEAGKPAVMSVRLDALIGAQDVRTLGRGYLPDDVLQAWPNRSLVLKTTVTGNMSHLSLANTEIGFPGALMLSAGVGVNRVLEDSRSIAARFLLKAPDASFVKAFLPADSRDVFDIPRGTTLEGTASMCGDDYSGNVRLLTGGGQMTLKGKVNTAKEQYEAVADAVALPLGQLLPGSGLHEFSGSASARGANFDVLSVASRLQADVRVDRFRYEDWDLDGLSLAATSVGGNVHADFSSKGKLLKGDGTIDATLGQLIKVSLRADLPWIDLQHFAAMSDTVQLGTSVEADFYTDRAFKTYGASGGVKHLRFLTPRRSIPAENIVFDVATAPDTTTAYLAAGDLDLHLGSKGDVSQLSEQLERFMKELTRQMGEKTLDQEALRLSFPVVDFTLEAGQRNPLRKIMHFNGFSYRSLCMEVSANPRGGLSGGLHIGALEHGTLLLDTIHLALSQDTTGIHLDGGIQNYEKENPNKFEVLFSSWLSGKSVGVQLQYLDEQRRKGVDLGLLAQAEDEGLRLSVTPMNPILAYRNFTVNADNYIFLGRQKQISANLNLVADDNTGLRITGEPMDSVNDLSLNVTHLRLDELCNVMPYLPKMSGVLNGDFHVIDDHEKSSLSTAAQMSVDDFVFEDARLGNVGVEAVYLPKAGGEHYANAYISAEGLEVLQCEGTYYDPTSQFNGSATLLDCPLRLLNGFLAGADIALDGTAGGTLDLSGTVDSPVINGALQLDSAHVYSDVYGFNWQMDERPLQITDSRLHFDDYGLYAATDSQPMVVNGDINLSNLSKISMDLSMKATNFPIINAQRKASSLVYGKVYADFTGTMKGTTDDLSIRGQLNVLDRTDMTYVLKDSPLTVEDRLSDLVQFVDFNDTTSTHEERTAVAGGFDMTLGISVSDAARFSCRLSDDGSSYVDLEGGGDLTMRITQQGDMRLTGRFTANSGEMKYTLPVIPLKTFTIVQGSYVDFTGDVANPTLNIAAKERVKATVTENDQPRSVAFNVGVAITQPLSNMGLEFTIEAPEDLTIQNQLTAMSLEQRSKVAVAMLATGMYVTDDLLSGGTTSGFKASNALNAFLQSEIQNIAGSALKTIDLTVGMESGTSTTGTTTTDYSFQFAKRFWNDRISVVIGGKVSTGQDANNSAESFIDNIAVEYRLDNSSTRYVKVFYDRSTRDPLEGQLVRTGAGLVLRRKTDRLGELFIFKKSK